MTEEPARSPTAQPPNRPVVQIDRCVCLNGLCRPYLRRMLSTGERVFHQMLEPGAK